MSIDSVGSRFPAQPTVTNGQSGKPRVTEMGKDEFLELLVAQLKNQDPLSPLQPHEFAAQLAQFSSVEQLTQVNEGLTRQLEANTLNTLAVQTSLSASLLSKQVVVGGDLVSVTAGEPTQLLIDAPPGGGTTTVTITDATGEVVATKELGTIRGGRQTLSVDGLPEGIHHFSVSVTGTSGVPVAASTFTSGVVDGVHFEGGELMLRMGNLKVPMNSLVEIQPAPAAATADEVRPSSFASALHPSLLEHVGL